MTKGTFFRTIWKNRVRMMKRFLSLLLVLLMLPCALAEEEVLPLQAAFEPIPWDVTISPNAPNPDAYLPDQAGYHDDSIDIRVETFRSHDTTVMAMYVTLTDVSQFRTSLSGINLTSKSVTYVSNMTRRVQAVAGINGDYPNYHNQGIIYRNGQRHRFNPIAGRDTLIIDGNGDFHILSPTTKEAWDAYLEQGGTVLHSFAFGPGLVIDGEPLTDLETVRLDCGKYKDTQRIVIGQTGPLQYLILATEGPENEGSVGFDLLEMTELCMDMGMINAYNLDGGSSSTIVLNNEKINSLSTGKVRQVGDCIWFATLVPSADE